MKIMPYLLAIAVMLALTVPAHAAPNVPGPLPVLPAPTPLTVDQAVAIALVQNPALREAAGRSAVAWSAVERAKAPLQPQLSADVRYDDLSFVPSFALGNLGTFSLGANTTWVTDLVAKQVVFSGGRLQALVREATDQARATSVTNQRTRQQVVYTAARAFQLLVAAQREQQTAQQSLAAAAEHLRVANASFEARTVAHFDVLRAQVQVEEARQQTISATSDIAIAHAGLLNALGVEQGNFTAVETEPAAQPAPVLEGLLQQAHNQRPELQAVDWQLSAADAALAAAKGETQPTVALQIDYQGVKPDTPSLWSRLNFVAVASLPILDGGAAKADLHQAQAQHTQLMGTRDVIRTQVDMEVRQAYARLTSAADQVTVARSRVAEAEEALRIANVRYAAGVGTAVEVADAESSLTSAQQGLTQALTQWGIASAELRYAVGTPAPVAPATGTMRLGREGTTK